MDTKEVLKIDIQEVQSKNDTNEKTPPSCISILSYCLIIIILIFFLLIGMYTFVMLKNPIKLI